ncbi:MAG: hypothetical protein N3E39_00740 [Candidatus Methanomethylicia archaeon]|nr:hypothetical protein [Candidatus Methanomethylicia archaeon]
MSEWDPIIFQLGAGGITGFIVGYALKKLLKILMVIVGLFILALAYLQWSGIVRVDYTALINKIEGMTKGIFGEPAIINQIIANIPLAGAFSTGFFLGYKIG